MQPFMPFGNDSQSLAINEFTLENQGEQLNLYGSLTLTVDKESLENAKQLQAILAQAIAYLEKHNAQTIEKATILASQQANVTEVGNPFA